MRPANRLAREKSPYLLQHAHNPVDWYPWGEEAFESPRRRNPIFLSIGYSTCHWCHVMERESFEDEEVARLLNEAFVAIKVDREERPDVDHLYMTVCQVMTGGGGWPLTIVMTPGQAAVLRRHLLPQRDAAGAGRVCSSSRPLLGEAWRDAAGRGPALGRRASTRPSDAAAGRERGDGETRCRTRCLDEAYRELSGRFRRRARRLRQRAQVPHAPPDRSCCATGSGPATGEARAMVERTLDAMRRGGIYDHVGFGFHRYSTDDRLAGAALREDALRPGAAGRWPTPRRSRPPGSAEFRRTAAEIARLRPARPDLARTAASSRPRTPTARARRGSSTSGRDEEFREAPGPTSSDLASRVFGVNRRGQPHRPSGGAPGRQHASHRPGPWELASGSPPERPNSAA